MNKIDQLKDVVIISKYKQKRLKAGEDEVGKELVEEWRQGR
ncbi:MAG: hypothetical protein AAFQ94_10965 [Bacteroidota bacterium]